MTENISKYFEGTAGRAFVEFVDSRPDNKVLSLRIKLLSYISACQASSEFELLKGVIGWALEANVEASEIYEVLLQGHLFTGYPNALESFFIFDEVIESRGLNFSGRDMAEKWDKSIFQKRGLEAARKIYATNLDLVLAAVDKISPDLASGMINEGYGRIISRPGLDLIARELSIVTILTINRMPRQLYSHIRGAFNVGAARDEIAGVIKQCAYFTQPPAIAAALTILEKSLGNYGHPR